MLTCFLIPAHSSFVYAITCFCLFATFLSICFFCFCSGENDPFFIKGNEQMIGRSLIYLDPINHLLPISSKTPIIDYNGFSRFGPEAIVINSINLNISPKPSFSLDCRLPPCVLTRYNPCPHNDFTLLLSHPTRSSPDTSMHTYAP